MKNAPELRVSEDVIKLFASLSTGLIGVGITAFSRIVPSYFLKSYHIVSLRKTLDIRYLRDRADIFCLEYEAGKDISEKGFNSARLLEHPLTRQYLNKLPGAKHLLLYQNYPELEKLAEQESWSLLANPSSLRTRLSGRHFFQDMLDSLGLPRVPGSIYPLRVIHERSYDYWSRRLGPSLVIQLAEITQGGGRGTFFIRSESDFLRLRECLKENTWRGVKLNYVSIHSLVEGIPVSVALCITKYGILISRLQRQLIDLPWCNRLYEKGVFCGHAWDETPWPTSVIADTRKQALSIGQHLSGLGYKGILGIDFVLHRGQERVYPLEINPRFTGAFPMLSLLHMEKEVIPLDAFHILEFLDVTYRIDVEELNSRYSEPVTGSHILVFLHPNPSGTRMQAPEPGLYEVDPRTNEPWFIRWAGDYKDIRNERQFIILDGPPDMANHHSAIDDPFYRLCRLLFSFPVVDHAGIFSDLARNAVDWVYRRMFG
jgi:hypothetical protein